MVRDSPPSARGDRLAGASIGWHDLGAGPALGLDIGGTKLAAGVVTRDGEVLGYTRTSTPQGRRPDEVLAELFRTGRRSLEAVGLDVVAIGIACGGPLDRRAGIVFSPPHLPLWDGVPVAAIASDEFGLPAHLENDATCGAIAEYEFGAGRGREAATLLYLTISTGIGGGFIADGRLLLGAAGNGGEPGHITVVKDGRPCLCGRRGCLEAYCSGAAIAARALERLARGESSTLAGEEIVTAERVFLAARAGDLLAGSVWEETVALLGQGLTSLVNVFEPDLLVLGGGVTRSGAALFDPVTRMVKQEAMRPAGEAVQIRPAALGEAVCVAGAGTVALVGAREEAA